MPTPSTETVFSPYRLGELELPNRIVMAPLTRSRAAEGGIPTPLMAEYYAQRSDAGLIIAEATQISAQGRGYEGTPGIYTDGQVAGWELVTHAVHTCGGKIFLQLWHVGRISHTSLQPGEQLPVAPSAIAANAQTFVDGQFTSVSEPRALNLDEIPGIVQGYVLAARNALWAGFDGVRFLAEVIQAVIKEAGEDCVGVRISPVSTVNDVHDSNTKKLFNHVVEVLDRLKPVYLHVIEGQTDGPRDFDPSFGFCELRRKFHGAYMANNGYTLALANQSIQRGAVDLVAFGRPFIANPDLVERFHNHAPLSASDPTTLYGGGAKGYTDYPAMEAERCAVP